MGRPTNDITGRKYDNLTVISKTKHRNLDGGVLWKLCCDCGDICYATSSDLNRGRRNFCPSCNNRASRLSPIKSLYGNYKRSALDRGYEFRLTLYEFAHMIKQKCFYCGESPNQWYKKEGAKEGVFYNGIDRVDNEKGYVVENSVPCCKFCNFAKKDNSKDEYLSWLYRVAQRKVSV